MSLLIIFYGPFKFIPYPNWRLFVTAFPVSFKRVVKEGGGRNLFGTKRKLIRVAVSRSCDVSSFFRTMEPYAGKKGQVITYMCSYHVEDSLVLWVLSGNSFYGLPFPIPVKISKVVVVLCGVIFRRPCTEAGLQGRSHELYIITKGSYHYKYT